MSEIVFKNGQWVRHLNSPAAETDVSKNTLIDPQQEFLSKPVPDSMRCYGGMSPVKVNPEQVLMLRGLFDGNAEILRLAREAFENEHPTRR